MASKSHTKGNPKPTRSDRQKQQIIVAPGFHSNSQSPPGFVHYSQQPGRDGGVLVYSQPQTLSTNNPYADPWNTVYYTFPPTTGPPLGMPIIPSVMPYDQSPTLLPLPSNFQLTPPSLTPKLKKRTIRPPSKEYLATKLVDNALGLTNMIRQEETPSLTPKLKKRTIRPPSKEYLATKLVDNPLGLTNMIRQEENLYYQYPKEPEFNTPWVWRPAALEDEPASPPSPSHPLEYFGSTFKGTPWAWNPAALGDEPASPPSPPHPPEDFSSKVELKPAFPSNIVRTPYHYVPVRPRQTTEPERTTSSIVTSSSVPVPHASPSLPLHPISDESFPPSPVITRSTSPVVNSSSETSSPPITPFITPHPLQNGLSSPTIIPPRSAPSAIGVTPTGPTSPQRKVRKGQPVDLPSTSYEASREDEPESITPNTNQTTQLPPQNSGRGTAPWILASRKLHAPKKPVDVQFIARMAELRQQADGTNSTSSTPQARQSMALLGSPVSIASSAFSQSFSVASPPPAVNFPPTPVFTDQIPEGFMRKFESLSLAQTPKASLSKPHPLQDSHPATATRSLDTIREVASSSTTPSSSNSTPKQQPNKLPVSTIRRGYWNRRGDHLTPEGYLVFPPPSMRYPDELKAYPFENEGYRDHSGLFTAHMRRPELPQSLPKHGNLPERPYESFVVYV